LADIFISYKREEQPISKRLADALQEKGWTVWWDPEIRAGERFDDVIEKALIESKCVVVLWSKLSVESQNVKDEATYALNRDKLVPILIEEVNLPFRFERINTGQLIDWDGSDKFPGFQKLIADVISLLGEPPVEQEKRKREQAEREAERKRRAEEQRKAEEDKQRLADQKRKFEEEQRRVEAAHKAEEERKLKETETQRKADVEKRLKEQEEQERKAAADKRRKKDQELERRAEEERQKREAEAKRKAEQEHIEAAQKAEEERKQKETEAKRRADVEIEGRPLYIYIFTTL